MKIVSPVRRKIICLFFFLLFFLGTIFYFGKSGMKQGIIWLVSRGIEIGFKEKVSCKDFSWSKDRLIFYDVKASFSKSVLKIPRLELSFSWKHWLHLKAIDGPSLLDLQAVWSQDALQITLDFSHWDLLQLQPWLFLPSPLRIERGELEGKVLLERKKNEPFHVTAHLQLTLPSFFHSLGNVSCKSLDLEGEGSFEFSEIPILEPSWVRTRYKEGCWQSRRAFAKQLEGSFFYSADLGMQWDSTGFVCLNEESSHLSLSGKGFWADPKDAWIEVEIDSTAGKCLAKKGFHAWKVQLENIQPFWGRFLRALNPNLVPLGLKDFDWEKGEISSTFEIGSEKLKWENFAANDLQISHRAQEEKSLRCEHLEIGFASEKKRGVFSVNGVHLRWPFDFGYQIIAADWSSNGGMAEGEFFNSTWSGQVEISNKDEEKFRFSSTLDLSSLESGSFKIQGLAAEYPFEMQIFQEDSLWSLFFQGSSFFLTPDFGLENIKAHLLIGLDRWGFQELFADFLFHQKRLHLNAARLEKKGDQFFWDLRLERGFWDIFRLFGSYQEGKFVFDPLKTEVLGACINIEPIDPKASSLKLSIEIPWESSFLLEEFGGFVPLDLKTSLSGSLGVDFQYEKDLFCKWSFRTDRLFWEGRKLPYELTIEKLCWAQEGFVNLGSARQSKIDPNERDHLNPCKESEEERFYQVAAIPNSQNLPARGIKSWQVSLQSALSPEMDWPDLNARFALVYDKGSWSIQKGEFRGVDPLFGSLSCHFYGQYQKTKQGQLIWEDAFYCFDGGQYKIESEGKGCFSFDLPSLDWKIDMDLLPISLQTERFDIKQTKPVHAFFSPSKGWMLQGLDLQWKAGDLLLGESQIDLLHYHPSIDAWSLQEAHLHCSEEIFPVLAQEEILPPDWLFFQPHQDIDLVADLRIDSGFSKFSFFVKEGLLPLNGQLRHIQNLELFSDEKQISCDFLYVHQNQDVQTRLQVLKTDPPVGKVFLESPGFPLLEGEEPLEISWQYHPDWGILIDSIQGSFSGLSVGFNLQASDCQSHLIGSCSIDCARLLPFVPPAIAEFFTELNMGKGYELKGKLHIDRKNISEIFFTGLIHGKEIELCGCQFRSFLSQIDIRPEQVRIFDLKISDLSGFYKIDTILMQGKGDDPWTFHIPLLSFSEFRPSFLRKIGEAEGSLSPLVIRDMRFRDIRGILENKQTYTAEGELYFINSYKRENSVFDVPSNVLGRIIGLDMELLIPVRGVLRYVLKEGRFHITALEEAFSEADRSQFFLSNKMVSTVDLDGNVQIGVKMKQHVLFKLTEAFTILIDGKLNDPNYHLQKKK